MQQHMLTFNSSLIDIIKSVEEKKFQTTHSFEIDCNLLPEEFHEGNILLHNDFSAMFNQLQKINGPVLYWYETIGSNDTRNLYDRLSSYKCSEYAKSTPALKKITNWNSNVLYVGKCKGQVCGRTVVHLGYFRTKATQGLQLSYWARNIDLKLRLNIIEMPDNSADVLSIYENRLAMILQPLFGKHK